MQKYFFHWVIWREHLAYIKPFSPYLYQCAFLKNILLHNHNAIFNFCTLNLGILLLSDHYPYFSFVNWSNSVLYRILFLLVQNPNVVFSYHITLVLFSLGTNSLVILGHLPWHFSFLFFQKNRIFLRLSLAPVSSWLESSCIHLGLNK